MWEPRRLTTLWASTTSYRDSFTFFLPYSLYGTWWFTTTFKGTCPGCFSRQMDALYTPVTYFQLSTFLQQMSSSLKLSFLFRFSEPNFVFICQFSYLYYLSFQFCPPSFDHPNNHPVDHRGRKVWDTICLPPLKTLWSWVWITLEAWMLVCVCSVFVLSCVGSGLATGLITRPMSPTDCTYSWDPYFQS
jgi:hypothetical protein